MADNKTPVDVDVVNLATLHYLLVDVEVVDLATLHYLLPAGRTAMTSQVSRSMPAFLCTLL